MAVSKSKQLSIHKFTLILFVAITVLQYLYTFYQWSYILARHNIGIAFLPALIISLVVSVTIFVGLNKKSKVGLWLAVVLLGWGVLDSIFTSHLAGLEYLVVLAPLIYNRKFYLNKK